jgi:hypothetical protein
MPAPGHRRQDRMLHQWCPRPNRRLRHGALVAFDVPFVPGMDTELERDVIPDFGVWPPERQRLLD